MYTKEQIIQAIRATLNPYEAIIMNRRFGIFTEKPLTKEETQNIFHITQQELNSIENKMITYLKLNFKINIIDSAAQPLKQTTFNLGKTSKNIGKNKTISYDDFIKIILLAERDLSFESMDVKSITNCSEKNLYAHNLMQIYFLYEDCFNKFKIKVGWIYTKEYIGNGLYWVQKREDDTSCENDLLVGYENIIIHIKIIGVYPSVPGFAEQMLILTIMNNFLKSIQGE